MKKLFFLTGVGCSGKSYYAETIAKEMGSKLVRLDFVYANAVRKLNNKYTWIDIVQNKVNNFSPYTSLKELLTECYKDLFVGKTDNILICGESPVVNPVELEIIKGTNPGYQIIVLLLKASYKKWLINRTNRFLADKNAYIPHFLKEKEYYAWAKTYEDKLKDYNFITIDSDDFKYQGTTTGYQVDGFSDKKWEKIKTLFPSNMVGKSIIDIGSNAGYFVNRFSQLGASVLGIDRDWRLLVESKIAYPNIKVICGQIENLDINTRFDYILCMSAFHFFEDKEKALDVMAKLSDTLILEIPVEENQLGLTYMQVSGSFVPSRFYLMEMLSKRYKNIEYMGMCDVGNRSRPIFKCTK